MNLLKFLFVKNEVAGGLIFIPYWHKSNTMREDLVSAPI